MVVDKPAFPAPVCLLGAPALNTGRRPVPFEPERPFVLLAYLACRGDWVRRDELADLLYPGRSLEAARSNLRKVIFLARKVEGVGTMEQQGELLRWAPDSDLRRFEAACNALRWGEAVDAYGGALLLGLDPAFPPDAAEWLQAERQRLQSRWHEACRRRLGELADEPGRLRDLAERMLRHDPLDDEAQHALGRAQKALGEPGLALRSLADYRQRLAEQAGLAPSAALEALAEELRHNTPPPPPPTPMAVVVGRRHEQQRVRRHLADPACRVLTILGPPGVGKSTLLRLLQAEQPATWVPLEALTTPDQVPAEVALRLGLALDARSAPWAALAQALAGRPALLLLDNAEHLTLAEGLTAMLDAAPQVRVVVASRAPLGLPGEWRLLLEGLPLPDADERDPEVLRANDAVRLFEQRALPLAPAFSLAAEAADVVALLHAVEGLPLAIELLAAWRRLMPVCEIRAELAASLDVLEPSLPSERSVRASFARSWQQLGALEQRVLAQLAVLPGPCGRELLRGVLQAPLPVLANLVDRSLLRAAEDGRIALHPLVRRCAADHAGDTATLRERHARHVAQTLGRSDADLSADLPHVQAAWQWAVERHDTAVLGALVGGYMRFLSLRARWRDGLAEARAGEAVLVPLVDAAKPTQGAALALGQVQSWASAMHYSLGDLDAAVEAARQALALADRFGLLEVAATAWLRLGAVNWQRGRYEDAREAFLSAHRAAIEAGQEGEARRMLSWLPLVDKALGRYEAALDAYRDLVAHQRAQGTLPGGLYLLNNMGNLLRLMGRGEEALVLLHEALQLARNHQQTVDEPFLLTNIALVHETEGRLAESATWARQAVDSALENGEPMIEAAARLLRARLAATQHRDAGAAWADVRVSLAIAQRTKGLPLTVQCLSTAGLVLAHTGEASRGFAIVRWAMAHSSFALSERQDAERHLRWLDPLLAARQPESLPATLSPDEVLALLPAAARP